MNASAAPTSAQVIVDDLLQPAQALVERSPVPERHDPDFVAWYFEAATFVKEHTPELSRGFVDGFSLKGTRIGEGGEDAAHGIQPAGVRTRRRSPACQPAGHRSIVVVAPELSERLPLCG